MDSAKRCLWLGALLIALIAAGRGTGQEPQHCDPAQTSFLQRWYPAGGWHPYGGGLLSWWNPYCFPRCGGPDDYCRKPLPKVCWPAYPPYYTWGRPEVCCPPRNNSRDCSSRMEKMCKPHLAPQ
jgi:hypothetical protein